MRLRRHRLCQCKKYVLTISWTGKMAPKPHLQACTVISTKIWMTLWAMRYFLKYEHYLNKHSWFGFCSSASVSITQTETWDFFFFSPKPKGFYRTWKLADRIFKKKREHAEFLIWYVLIYLNYLDLYLSFCHIGKYKRVLLDWGSNISGNLDWFYVFYVWLLPSVTLIHLHFESICRLNFLYLYVYFLRRSVMLSDVSMLL